MRAEVNVNILPERAMDEDVLEGLDETKLRPTLETYKKLSKDVSNHDTILKVLNNINSIFHATSISLPLVLVVLLLLILQLRDILALTGFSSSVAGQNGAVVRRRSPGVSQHRGCRASVGHSRGLCQECGELQSHNLDLWCQGGP